MTYKTKKLFPNPLQPSLLLSIPNGCVELLYSGPGRSVDICDGSCMADGSVKLGSVEVFMAVFRKSKSFLSVVLMELIVSPSNQEDQLSPRDIISAWS